MKITLVALVLLSTFTGCSGPSPVRTIEGYYTCSNAAVRGDAFGGRCYLPLFSDEYIQFYGSLEPFVKHREDFDEFYGSSFDSWEVKNSLLTESRAEITMSEMKTNRGSNLTPGQERKEEKYYLEKINGTWKIANLGSTPTSWSNRNH